MGGWQGAPSRFVWWLGRIAHRRSMVIMRIPVAGVTSLSLSRFAARACRAARLKGSLGVLVTNNREMRLLNKRFRRKNKPTDVLSFPPMTNTAHASGRREHAAGDLAISAQIAASNARCLGHSTSDEVKVLILHGILHLAGYDHESDHGQMARKEQKLRKSLGLPAGLIERSAALPRVAAKKKRRVTQ